jgi:hypothetical protein
MTTDDCASAVRAWLAGAKHPRFERAYTEVVYQPMLEFLSHLHANAWKTRIEVELPIGVTAVYVRAGG